MGKNFVMTSKLLIMVHFNVRACMNFQLLFQFMTLKHLYTKHIQSPNYNLQHAINLKKMSATDTSTSSFYPYKYNRILSKSANIVSNTLPFPQVYTHTIDSHRVVLHKIFARPLLVTCLLRTRDTLV